MAKTSAPSEPYQGFELGPIRPPSEAASLLLRVTRNCPWNRCTFCDLYRGETFSIRPVDHLRRDIDQIKIWIDQARDLEDLPRDLRQQRLAALQNSLSPPEQLAFHTAMNWLRNGMRSVFLQDANSLVMPPAELAAVLEYLRRLFPQVARITSYARSQSVARISDADLARLAAAGLNRIHIGMESGSDQVLARVRKGVDQATHVAAGHKVKAAGIELSEYVMPGLGGREHSEEHALQTAMVLNQIDPDFIRIRSLAIPGSIDLCAEVRAGTFTPLSDQETVAELLLLLESLEGITSMVKSDHILNLLQEVEGRLPDGRERMLEPLRAFLAMPAEQQLLYQVGRRSGIFAQLADLEDHMLRWHAEKAVAAHRVTPDNVERWIAEMLQRYI